MKMNLFGFPPLAVLVAPFFYCAAPASELWLSSLDLSPVIQGWGKAQADRAVTGKPLAISGQKFEHGVGTHADSLVRLDLEGGAEKFSAWVGVDDAAGKDSARISFKIVGDGKTLWKSSPMRLGDPAQHAEVEVKRIKNLLLLATSGDSGISYAHADWADAKFIVTGDRPVVVGPPHEKAVILTPKPPSTPRINGPRIFGVRPGHPFLFTIPATGHRPMIFAVQDLPEGLRIEPSTGQITGKIPQPGEYVVTFHASNHLGTAQRKFRIVCGDTLALTPHMGWNSWYVWEGHVTDQIMRQAADAMVSSGMINHGYQYVNIDDCWSVKPGAKDPTLGGEPRDARGKVNANKRFPDMRALTDYIHAKGLKAGTYTSPGSLTCAGHVAAYQHEELDVQRFTEWGFDFLKYDWCSYGRIAKDHSLAELEKPYRLVGEILRRQERDVVLNLCQYGMGKVWEWGKAVGGHSWRTAGDLGGSFEGIPVALFRDGFDVYTRNQLYNFGGPGGWNDPDYLLLGYLSNWKGATVPSPLTPNEQYTQVSLWSLQAAPLIFSGDITRLDDFTLSLLTNDDVLDVDQDPLGKPGRRVALDDDREVWVKEMEDGSKAVGLFNRGEGETTVSTKWANLGIRGQQLIRDLWHQENLGTFAEEFRATVPRHGVVMIRVSPK
jgi:alpha-galactosidase